MPPRKTRRVAGAVPAGQAGIARIRNAQDLRNRLGGATLTRFADARHHPPCASQRWANLGRGVPQLYAEGRSFAPPLPAVISIGSIGWRAGPASTHGIIHA